MRDAAQAFMPEKITPVLALVACVIMEASYQDITTSNGRSVKRGIAIVHVRMFVRLLHRVA